MYSLKGGPPPPPIPGALSFTPPKPPPNVLPHGMKPKKKWNLNIPLKKANWKTVSVK